MEDHTMRGRRPRPLPDIEKYPFDKLSKTEGSSRERRRYLAFAHIQEGKSFSEVALIVRVQLRTLMAWVQKFREKGLDGLKEQPGRGCKPHLAAEQQEAFKNAVLELQKNRQGGRIKGGDVLALMKTKFGIEPSLRSVYDTLKRADLVWITGRSQHPDADLEAQETFKKTSKKT
jgi:transposase